MIESRRFVMTAYSLAWGSTLSSDAFGPILFVGMLGILVSVLYMAFGRRVLVARKIDKVEARIKAGAPFCRWKGMPWPAAEGSMQPGGRANVANA